MKAKISILCFALVCSANVFAYDFIVGGIYYEIISSSQNWVEVTQRGWDGSSKYTGDIVIPETVQYNKKTYTVKQIGEQAFAFCPNLTSVTIPNSVKTICSHAFYECLGLTSIIIPESVGVIERGVFGECYALTSITFDKVKHPSGGINIGDKAFFKCSNLKSLHFPSYTSLGERVLQGCSSLESLMRGDKNDGNYIRSGSTLIYGCKNSIIPTDGSVTAIRDYAFDENDGLTSISIPDTVTTIGQFAFIGCNNLQYNVHEDVDYLGNEHNPYHVLIRSRNKTTTYSIPNQTKVILDRAFYDSQELCTISIGRDVIAIGKDVFHRCPNLTSVIWNVKQCPVFPEHYTPFFELGASESSDYDIRSQITSFIFGDDVEQIPAYLCNGMENITSINIPHKVKTVGTEVFHNCTNLSLVKWNAKQCDDCHGSSPFGDYEDNKIDTIHIGDSVKHIPAGLFRDKESLKVITIGVNVSSIGENCFYDCNNLVSVQIEAIEPPTGNGDIIVYQTNGYYSRKLIINVPCLALLKYKSHNSWSSYRLEAYDDVPYSFTAKSIDESMGSVNMTTYPTCENNLIATFEATPMQGYKFVEWNDGNAENPRTVEIIEDVEYIANFAAIDNAVENISVDNTLTVRKVFENNTIFILRGGEKYTIDGRKITTL